MTKIIYKIQLDLVDEQVIKLTKGFKILKVDLQQGALTVWFETPISCMSTDHISVTFNIYGTGDLFHGSGEHVGTVFEGRLVWHVYMTLPS